MGPCLTSFSLFLWNQTYLLKIPNPRCTSCTAGELAISRNSTSREKISPFSGDYLQFQHKMHNLRTKHTWEHPTLINCEKVNFSVHYKLFVFLLNLTFSGLDFVNWYFSAVNECCWATAGKLTSMTGKNTNTSMTGKIQIHQLQVKAS